VTPHLDETMLVAREALVHLANRALGVGQLLLRVLERRVTRVEVALPMGDLFGELGIGARKCGELELERFEATRR
jgi:hypothetical protein